MKMEHGLMMRIFRQQVFSVLAIFFMLNLSGCTPRPRESLVLEAMDTVCTINLFEDGRPELYEKVTECIKYNDALFSISNPQSDTSRVNASAGIRPEKVSREFLHVLKVGMTVASLTDSAFNPCAGALIDLWNINGGSEKFVLPEESEAERAGMHGLSDWRKMQVDGDTVFLPYKGMKINLGAIAKGWVCDCVVEVLKENNVRRAVIDLGGNVYVYGRKSDGSPWTVGIKDPQNPDGLPFLKLTLNQNSVVTSGGYERYVVKDGIRYHHILDVWKGRPAQSDLASVTVIAPSSLVCDALSTAAFVLGQEKTRSLAPEFSREFAMDIGFVFISRDMEWTTLGSSFVANEL